MAKFDLFADEVQEAAPQTSKFDLFADENQPEVKPEPKFDLFADEKLQNKPIDQVIPQQDVTPDQFPLPAEGVNNPLNNIKNGMAAGFKSTMLAMKDVIPTMVKKPFQTDEEHQLEVAAILEKQNKINQTYLPAFQSFEQAIDKSDGSWGSIAKNVGTQAAYHVGSAIGSGILPISALAAFATAPQIMGILAARGIVSEAGAIMAGNVAAKAAIPVTFAANAVQSIPTSYIVQLGEGIDNNLSALGAGLVNAAVYTLPDVMAFNRIMPDSMMNALGQKVTQESLKKMGWSAKALDAVKVSGVGGLSASAASMIDDAAVKIMDNNKDFFTPEHMDKYLDTLLAGAVGTAGVLGAHAGFKSTKDRILGSPTRENPVSDKPEDISVPYNEDIVKELRQETRKDTVKPTDVEAALKSITEEDEKTFPTEAVTIKKEETPDMTTQKVYEEPSKVQSEKLPDSLETTPDILIKPKSLEEPVKEGGLIDDAAVTEALARETEAGETTIDYTKRNNGEFPAVNKDVVALKLGDITPFEATKSTVGKAVDRILTETFGRTTQGKEPVSFFHNLFNTAEADTISPKEKAQALNVLKVATDLRGDRAKELIDSGVEIAEAFDHITQNTDVLSDADRAAIDSTDSQNILMKKISEKTGLNKQDVSLMGVRGGMEEGFRHFVKDRIAGKPTEGYGPIAGVYNKVFNAINRTSSMLNKSGIKDMNQMFSTNRKGHDINSALRESVMDIRAVKQKLNSDNVNNTTLDGFATKKAADFEQGKDGIKLQKKLTSGKPWSNLFGSKQIGSYWNFVNSLPALANRFPYASDIFYHYSAKAREIHSVNYELKRPFDEILKQRPNSFHIGLKILDTARETGKNVEFGFDKNGKEIAIYHDKNGERRILTDEATVRDMRVMRDMFKKCLTRQVETFKDVLPRFSVARESTPAELTTMADSLEKSIEGVRHDLPGIESIKTKIKVLRKVSDILTTAKDAEGKDYFPHMRFGDRYVAVYDHTKKDKENPRGKLVYYAKMESTKGGIINRHQLKKVKDDVSRDYNNSAVYNVIGLDEKGPRKATHQELKNLIDDGVESMEAVYALLGDGDPEGYQKLQDEIAKLTGQAGLPSNFRSSKGIKGYSEDYPRVIETYINALALSEVTSKYRGKEASFDHQIQNIIGKMDGVTPKDVDFIQNTKDYLQSNESDYINIRAANFIGTLGFNLSTGVLQLLNTPMAGVATTLPFAGYKAYGLGLSPVAKTTMYSVIKRAIAPEVNPYTESGKHAYEKLRKAGFSEDTLDDIAAMERTGQIGAVILDENIGTGYHSEGFEGGVKKTYEEMIRMSGVFTAFGEQKGRLNTAFYLHDLLKDPSMLAKAENYYGNDPIYLNMRQKHKELTGRQTMMLYLMDRIHGVYGKIGRGGSQRGLIGATLGAFTTYPIQQFENIADIAKKGGVKSMLGAAHMIATTAFITGLRGVAGYQLASALYNILGDLYEHMFNKYPEGLPHDFDDDTAAVLSSIIGPDIADWVQRGALRAIPGIDIDIGSRVGMMTPIETLLSKLSRTISRVRRDEVPTLNDLGIPAIDVLTRLMQESGNIMTAIPAVKNIATAAIDMNPKDPYASVKDTKGNPVISSRTKEGEPQFTGAERIKQGLGFTPTKLAKARELKRSQALRPQALKAGNAKYSDVLEKALVNMLRNSELASTSKTPEMKDVYKRRADAFASKVKHTLQNYQKFNINLGNVENINKKVDMLLETALINAQQNKYPQAQYGLDLLKKNHSVGEILDAMSRAEYQNSDAVLFKNRNPVEEPEIE